MVPHLTLHYLGLQTFFITCLRNLHSVLYASIKPNTTCHSMPMTHHCTYVNADISICTTLTLIEHSVRLHRRLGKIKCHAIKCCCQSSVQMRIQGWQGGGLTTKNEQEHTRITVRNTGNKGRETDEVKRNKGNTRVHIRRELTARTRHSLGRHRTQVKLIGQSQRREN